ADSVQTNTSSSTARRSIIAPIINTYQPQASIVSTLQQQQQQQQPQVDKISNHSISMTSPMGQSPERFLRPKNEKYDFGAGDPMMNRRSPSTLSM
ncbi:unnamed protein product, partial [Rotaria socialis]